MLKKALSSPQRIAGLFIIFALIFSLPLLISVLSDKDDFKKTEEIIQTAQNIVKASPTPVIIRTSQTTDGCIISDSEVALDFEEQQMITLINQYRQQNGLQPLTPSLSLTRAAAWMARDMANSSNTLSHTDSLGRLYGARSAACGYPSPQAEFENLQSSSFPSAQSAIDLWKQSPGHNMTMLNQIQNSGGGAPITFNFQAIGVARVSDAPSPFAYRWVAEFGETNDGGVIPTLAQATPTFTPSPTLGTSPTPTTFQGTITPTGTPQPTQSISTSVAAIVKLPGIGPSTSSGENPNPTTLEKNGEIRIFDQTGQIVSSNFVVFSFQQSNFTFKGVLENLNPGTYTVKIRVDNSLWKDAGIAQLTSNQTTNTQNITHVTGDVNQDNILNLQDYTLLISRINNRTIVQSKAAIAIAPYDLNLDGKIDEKDLNIFYSGLAKRDGD